MKTKSYNYKIILGIITGFIMSLTVVFASIKYKSSDVYYNNSNSTLTSADVQSAIDELAEKYSKIKNKSTTCPDGYTCTKNLLSVSDTIIELFNNASHATVTTAGDEIITQASSVSLMKDSFGNIRYYGASPNNYVSFNDETWRIIGVFEVEDENENTEQRIKIIRDESIGDYVFDDGTVSTADVASTTSNNVENNSSLNITYSDDKDKNTLIPHFLAPDAVSNGSNDWSTSSLKTYLNGDYYNGLTTTAKSMIGKAKYYLGGAYSNPGYYADDYYTFEMGTDVYSGHSTTWNGNIGIMYPSDYSYATDLSICKKDGYYYSSDKTNCTGTDWLFNSAFQLTISPKSSYYSAVYAVVTGSLQNTGYVDHANDVRPVLYLKSDISIVSGSGTSSDMYILG